MDLRNAIQLNKSFPTHGRLVSRYAPLLSVLVFSSHVLAQTRIVNCDAPLQSRKRGIAVNSLSDSDFRALAPGISWYYNWGATPLAKPADVVMDFLPMAWNGNASFQTSISNYLAGGNRPWRVLALNEPNLLGQAFMTPSNSAVTFKQVKAICDPYNIPVIAPHMAIGSAANQSITAYDPIMGSNYVYTFQEPFLNAFLYYCGSTKPAGVSSHSYNGYGEITWLLNLMHTDYPTQKVWMTEFCPWGAPDDATVLATLIPAVDFCERMSWVEGCAWFMSRITGDSHNSLLSGSGVLTAAGQAYVQMPVHDTNLYYRIPGRLQAERYVTLSQMDIAPTTDINGLADMKSTSAGGNVDYNIQVDSPGSYPLNFRVAGATGQIKVYKGGTLLGTANATQTSWATVSTTVALTAGTQTLHVVLAANAQQLNWMDFLATNGTPSVPFGLSATAGGDTQVVLNWLTSAGATSYNVKCSTTNGGPYVTISSPTATSYTNTGLLFDAPYYYVVSAVNGAGESANSAQATATPLAASYQQWQLQYFGSISDPNAASSADPDGDGMSNLQEFLAGTDPTNSASNLHIISVALCTNDVVITWHTVGGHTNMLQAANGEGSGNYTTTNFVDISPQVVVSGLSATTTNQVDAGGATNNPARFYRVRLVP